LGNTFAVTKYWYIFKTQLLNSLAYPGDLFSRSLAILMFMWIFTQLWRTTYQATSGSPDMPISGLTLRDTLWYLMLAETIVLSKPRLATQIAVFVKDGSIAYLLNKPYNFLLYQASVGMGEGSIQMIVNFITGGSLVWLLVGPPPLTSPASWLLVLVSILLAWMIDFCFSALIGMAAFVTEDVTAFEWIYAKFVLLLGGTLIPLNFLPGWLYSIVRYTPFAFSVYGPAYFFVNPSLSNFLYLFPGQITWLIFLGSLTALAYRKGMQFLTVNGG
jgi:ABC-2 type transport system permease protein